MFVLVKLLQILHFKGIFKARSEGLQGSLERIPALLFKHKAMEGTTRKVKMFDMKSWTSSSSLAWVLLPTALGNVVEEEDYCAVPLLAVLQGCSVTLGKGTWSLLSYAHTWSPEQPPSLAQSTVLMFSSASKRGGELEALQGGGAGVDLCLSEALHPCIHSIVLMPCSPCHYHTPLPTLQPRANLKYKSSEHNFFTHLLNYTLTPHPSALPVTSSFCSSCWHSPWHVPPAFGEKTGCVPRNPSHKFKMN